MKKAAKQLSSSILTILQGNILHILWFVELHLCFKLCIHTALQLEANGLLVVFPEVVWLFCSLREERLFRLCPRLFKNCGGKVVCPAIWRRFFQTIWSGCLRIFFSIMLLLFLIRFLFLFLLRFLFLLLLRFLFLLGFILILLCNL